VQFEWLRIVECMIFEPALLREAVTAGGPGYDLEVVDTLRVLDRKILP